MSLEMKRRVVGLPAVVVSNDGTALLKLIKMKILRAIGLGLVIIILQLLAPRIFSSIETASIATFDTVTKTMQVSQTAITTGGEALSRTSR